MTKDRGATIDVLYMRDWGDQIAKWLGRVPQGPKVVSHFLRLGYRLTSIW